MAVIEAGALRAPCLCGILATFLGFGLGASKVGTGAAGGAGVLHEWGYSDVCPPLW